MTEAVDPDSATEENEKARALIEELGLSGQKKFIGEVGETVPFRKMSQLETNVYKTLLGSRTSVDEYSAGMIPARVLDIVKRHRDSFERIDVLYSENDPDPVLVGVMKRENSTWQKDDFILARWGDELESIESLANKALDIIRGNVTTALQKAKTAIDADIEAAKSIGMHTLHKSIPNPRYYSEF